MKAKIATAALLAAMVATPAFGQSIPEGQSCGGLLCDMGVFGHKTAPEPKAAPVPPSPAVRAEAAPVAEPADPEPKPKAVRKKKRVAKAAAKDKAPAQAATAPEPVATPAPATRPTARPAAVVQTPVPFGWETTAALPPVPQPAPPVRPPQAKPTASASRSVNVIDLYSSLPASSGIQPLY